MKCPHCSKDIAEKVVLEEASRIMGRRSKRKLSPKEVKERDENEDGAE